MTSANTAINTRTLASPRLSNAALVDGENFDLVVTRQDDMTRGSPIRARATGETYEIDPFRGSASSSPTILKPCSLLSPRHPMPESDRAELRRRRNKLSCPETIGEISHIAGGDRERATTFAGVLDPLRGLIGSATLTHRIG